MFTSAQAFMHFETRISGNAPPKLGGMFAKALACTLLIIAGPTFTAHSQEKKPIVIQTAAGVPASIGIPESGLAGAFEVLSEADETVCGLAEVAPGPDELGRVRESAQLIVVPRVYDAKDAPPLEASATFRLGKRVEPGTKPTLEWQEVSPAKLKLMEGGSPVLVYNFGVITRDDIPESEPRRSRSCYVHPLYGVSGEILTDDFPKDHYHHHGVFWTWPHVVIDGQEYSLWEDKGGLRQRFVRWLCREAGATAAVLGVENGWFLGDTQVLTERVWLTVYRSDESRHIDVDLFFQPLGHDITLWGAEGKSYGGLTVRFRPHPGEPPKITVAEGLTTDDLYEKPLTWADFCSRFEEQQAWSGAAIFISPNHPDYPPTWLTRHYGPLCVGWPGTRSQTLAQGQSVHLPYRLWIHRGFPSAERIQAVYRAYCTAATGGQPAAAGAK